MLLDFAETPVAKSKSVLFFSPHRCGGEKKSITGKKVETKQRVQQSPLSIKLENGRRKTRRKAR